MTQQSYVSDRPWLCLVLVTAVMKGCPAHFIDIALRLVVTFQQCLYSPRVCHVAGVVVGRVRCCGEDVEERGCDHVRTKKAEVMSINTHA